MLLLLLKKMTISLLLLFIFLFILSSQKMTVLSFAFHTPIFSLSSPSSSSLLMSSSSSSFLSNYLRRKQHQIVVVNGIILSNNGDKRRCKKSLRRINDNAIRSSICLFNSNDNNNDDEEYIPIDIYNEDQQQLQDDDKEQSHDDINNDDNIVDVAIIGSGLGGLCAGAILNTIYGKKVGVYESHYLPGGAAHSFTRTMIQKNASNNNTNKLTFIFDSGPTILLGCSSPPYNALRQVLNIINQTINWIPYNSWGMIERITSDNSNHNHNNNHNNSIITTTTNTNENNTSYIRWKVPLGLKLFENGPLKEFGGDDAIKEFQMLQEITKPLLVGASIPVMAMRSGNTAVVPLITNHLGTFIQLMQNNPSLLTGTFSPYIDGPIYTVTNQWLRCWLDALAFSLSGLPANRTLAASMAFVLYDMHRTNATLDYPTGGIGEIINALIRGIEQKSFYNNNNGQSQSNVYLKSHVTSINVNVNDNKRVDSITLRNGRVIKTRIGIICNAPIWTLKQLLASSSTSMKNTNNNTDSYRSSWFTTNEGSSIALKRENNDNNNNNVINQSNNISNFLEACSNVELTGSFIHLHIVLNSTGININDMEAHYTYMDRSIYGNSNISINNGMDGPCSELNMIALSNPCKLDKSLTPSGYIMLHAYGAANEPYELWKDYKRNTIEYEQYKDQRAQPLYRAIESIIPDYKERIINTIKPMIGSPLTHERYIRRDTGTYGIATEDYLKDCSTPYNNLFIANDQIFPGIGIPSVAIVGTNAANSIVSVVDQLIALQRLKQ